MPVLRARKLMRAMPVGETLVVLATDDAAPADFEAFCRESGHGFGGVEQAGDTYRIRIEKTH